MNLDELFNMSGSIEEVTNEPVKRKWVSGYGVVFLDEKGIADLNRSRFIFLD